MSATVRFTVEGFKSGECRVYFEPEGAEILISPGDRLTVQLSGGYGPPEMEISRVPEGIAIWAWSGATTEVWDRSGQTVDV